MFRTDSESSVCHMKSKHSDFPFPSRHLASVLAAERQLLGEISQVFGSARHLQTLQPVCSEAQIIESIEYECFQVQMAVGFLKAIALPRSVVLTPPQHVTSLPRPSLEAAKADLPDCNPARCACNPVASTRQSCWNRRS